MQKTEKTKIVSVKVQFKPEKNVGPFDFEKPKPDPKPKENRSEKEIQSELIDTLIFFQNKLRFWINPTGKIKIEDRWISFSKPGFSDIFGFFRPNGTFLTIETKREKGGKKSQLQINFINQVNLFGGVGLFCDPSDFPGKNVSDYVAEKLLERGVISFKDFAEFNKSFKR